MPAEMRYGERSVAIVIDVSKYVRATGVDFSARTGLIFMLKSSLTLADIDAEYSTTEGTYLGVIGNEVTALIDDWSDLDIGEEYFILLGFKLSGDATYREIPMRGCAEKLLITQDGIRG